MAVRLGSRGVEGRHVGSMAGGVAVTAAVSDFLAAVTPNGTRQPAISSRLDG